MNELESQNLERSIILTLRGDIRRFIVEKAYNNVTYIYGNCSYKLTSWNILGRPLEIIKLSITPFFHNRYDIKVPKMFHKQVLKELQK